MGKGATILLVSSLLLMSIGFSAPVDGKQNGRQMSEGGSVILAKEIFWSDEPFEATIGLWGLSIGRNYSLDWGIFVGNDTIQNHPP
ncbi:MAG: hypothetical protein QF440_03000, partial [Candidatus Thalassarchaeaceae archaeon]|nr:hypothetical protein [Candidatus Thalassarchaeaceae archaeon]